MTVATFIIFTTGFTLVSAQTAVLYLGTVNQESQTIRIRLDAPGEVAGFQFKVNGVELCQDPECITGGSPVVSSWILTVGQNSIILGYTFGTDYIPPGDSLLVTLTYNSITGPELSLANAVIAAPPGQGNYEVEIGQPYVFIDGPIFGCMNPSAINFDPEATVDDGSCQFADIFGCTDASACNYNPAAGSDDGSCDFESCVDCAGVYDGAAFIDSCGICSGGTTGHWPNSDMDICGVCFGDGSNCTSELTFGELDQNAHTLELWLNTSTEISAFNIRISGVNLLSLSGGIAEELSDWTYGISMVEPDPNLYFDFFGQSQGSEYIPAGEHLLTVFTYDYLLATSICFTPIGTQFYNAGSMPVSIFLGDCVDISDQPMQGCTDALACNYNPYAMEDNGACEYESCYDCTNEMGGLGIIDDCGVCSGGSSGHVVNSDMDCAGECFGPALPDDCGICSGGNSGHEPNSDKDCAGECFGTSQLDSLGTCCQAEELDCAGICFGQAFPDDCDVCSGGTTGHEANADMDACGVCFGNAFEPGPDCNGDYCGGAYINECGYCVSGSTRFDRDYGMDCAGVCDGEALIDDCGICSGGTTGHEANSDMDCAGVCFGFAYLDDQGNCWDDYDAGFNAHMDCNGVYFGNSVMDECGDCVLPENFNAAMDDCGICYGANADMDCNGDCFGTAIVNECGCVGGNTGLPEFWCNQPPMEFVSFNQSTLQAYYFIANATIDGVELVPGEDWILAMKGDVCAGSVVWTGAYTTLPAMGDDGDEATAGYFEPGDIPSFVIYDGSTGIYYDASASGGASQQLVWENNGLVTIELLEAILRETQTRVLHTGSNLISFQVTPDEPAIGSVLADLQGNCFGVIGEGMASQPSPLNPDEWVGSIMTFEMPRGYWLKLWDADTLEIQGPAIASDISYDLHSGANLIGYPFFDSQALENAIPLEYWPHILAIIGEGEAAIPNPFTENDWLGSLTTFHGGNGYWIVVDQPFVFGWSEPLLARNEQWIEPAAEVVPTDLMYSQSVQQAFYFVENLVLEDGEPPSGDWLVALENGQVVGARQWTGRAVDIPAMGADGSPETAAYCEYGLLPEFKLYHPATGEWTELYGDIPEWQANAVFRISELTGYAVTPGEYLLSRPRPNPFNPVTTFTYTLPLSGPVELDIFNLKGRLVESLVREEQQSGEYELSWNARDVSSGVYLIKLKAGGKLFTRKMVLLK